jgi:glycosyltransferase involved in cell wall biosynthesis
MQSVKLMDKFKFKPLSDPPKVSVIMTACNEEASIEKALASRLSDTYSNIEFIIVNDRSTDRSLKIVKKTAGKDKRVKVVNITELPDGWLGKLNALQKGVEASTGEWLLFSDADIIVRSGVMGQVMAYAVENDLEHVAMLPSFSPISFFADAGVSAIIRTVIFGSQPWKIGKKGSDWATGSGSFNLVKRSMFEKIGGFESMKMEVIDDMALGQKLAKAGARPGMIFGRKKVSVKWYNSTYALFNGVGRTLFAGMGRFSGLRLTLIALIPYFFDMLPYGAFFATNSVYVQAVSVLTVIISLIVTYSLNLHLGHSIVSVLFPPISYTVAFFICIYSSIVNSFRGGINWKGTFYESKVLRKKMSFSLIPSPKDKKEKRF